MNSTNTCVACGTQFTSQQSSCCLRCILKNCAGSKTDQQRRVEHTVQKPMAVARPPTKTTSQPSPSSQGFNPNQGASKAFLAWQAKQLERLLLSQPKPPPAQHRERFPAGSSPWRAPRIVSMPLGTVCVLCGTRVPNMLHHKYEAHGEEPVVRSPATARKDRRWLTIVSGGLPSLGKRRK